MGTCSKIQRIGFESFVGLWIAFLSFSCCFGAISDNFCINMFNDKCNCTNLTVECHNSSLTDIKALYPFIKDNVENVTINGNNFTELPESALGSCQTGSALEKLKILDLSNNSIQHIHGKTFHCMPALEVLKLRQNSLKTDSPESGNGYFTAMPSLKVLNLSEAFDHKSTHDLSEIFKDTDMVHLKTLRLGRNAFTVFPDEAANTMCRLNKLITLDLSHNNLEAPSLPTQTACLEDLRYLDFSNNKMKRLTKDFISRLANLADLEAVRIEGNPFSCDCELLDTWHWLNKTNLVELKNHIRCADGFHSSFIGKAVLDVKLSELECEDFHIKPEPYISNTKAIIGIVFGIVGAMLIVLLVIFREKVKGLYKRLTKNLPKVTFQNGVAYKTVKENALIENGAVENVPV